MSYALSGVALTIASVIAYETLTNSEILPKITGPVLAVIIVSASFGYAFVTRKKSQETSPTN
jgi:hypothetical protein